MRVAIFGSWYEERSGFTCTGSLESFRDAGRDLGRLLARSGIELIVLSFTEQTIDGYVAEGLLEELANDRFRPSPPRDWVTVVNFDSKQLYTQDEGSIAKFDGLFARNAPYVTYRNALGRLLFDRHLAALRMADAVITIGGADHTFLAGEVATFAKVPLVPIGSFGGASRVLLEDAIKVGAESHAAARVGKLLGPWGEATLSTIHGLLSGFVVSVIHGRGDAWRAVQDMIRGSSTPSATFEPVVLRELLSGTESLAAKWESVASRAVAAIAVVTPDDIGGLSVGDETSPRARQNVWLEAGWIWGRLGRGRLLLLVQGNVEFPSDLGGVEFVRFEREPSEAAGQIRTFLERIARSADRE